MKIYTDFEQGSDQWRERHLGRPTASEFKNIITPVKGGFSKGHRAYAARLAAERITGGFEDVQEIFSKDILRGIEHEPRARAAYEYQTGATVRQVGFIESDDGRFGCSPDGLVYAKPQDALENPIGGLEFKCPKLANLLLWMEDGHLPEEHKCQVHGCLAITGLPWWDFVGFNAAMPDKLFIVRVEPDTFTKQLKEAMEKFDKILSAMTGQYR